MKNDKQILTFTLKLCHGGVYIEDVTTQGTAGLETVADSLFLANLGNTSKCQELYM